MEADAEAKSVVPGFAPIPPLIYGTARFAEKGNRPALVVHSLRQGYRALDTSSNRTTYEEKDSGIQLKEVFSDEKLNISREDVVLQTKYSPEILHLTDMPYDSSDPIPLQVLKSATRSVASLAVESVDVYFLHRPFEHISHTQAAWTTMEKIARNGGARWLGISQVDLETLQNLYDQAAIKPRVVQNYFSSKDGYDIDVRRYCRKKRIVYQAFGVLSQDNKGLLETPAVHEFSRMQSISKPSALFAMLWAVAGAGGEWFCILDGSKEPHHMSENLAALQKVGDVSEGMVAEIAELVGSTAEP